MYNKLKRKWEQEHETQDMVSKPKENKKSLGIGEMLRKDTGFHGREVAERMLSRTLSPRHLASVPNIQPLRNVERDPRKSEEKKRRLYFSGRV